jgi:hypothetical protein
LACRAGGDGGVVPVEVGVGVGVGVVVGRDIELVGCKIVSFTIIYSNSRSVPALETFRECGLFPRRPWISNSLTSGHEEKPQVLLEYIVVLPSNATLTIAIRVRVEEAASDINIHHTPAGGQ